eukprot:TRINITY_DN27379_c0_g1_i1.p1 TRINITY_DN27379_c0_g1~~TRINITY_DN27379_c0_g1_i1.p1  ORF type:complete len:696 (+),score=93.50 TRINITY_DN27379_c0_g1_i1:23-2110(+)
MSIKWEATAVALASTAVFVNLASRSVSGGDSGELLAACREFGVAHPPGYPLWISACWALDRFDFSWLLSPLCGGGTCAALYAATKTITHSQAAGLATVASLMCSQAFILYSCTAEVFSLNNFLCAMLLFLAAHYFGITDPPPTTEGKKSEKKDSTTVQLSAKDKLILWCAVFSALALGNQQTSVLFIVPAALVIIPHYLYTGLNGMATLVMSGTVFMVLFCGLYLLLMVSSHFVKTPNSWGSTFDMQGLLVHVLRSEYGTFSLANSKATYAKADALQSLNSWAYFCMYQQGSIFCVLSAIACVRLLFSGRSKALLLMCYLLVFYVGFFAYFGNLPLDTDLFQSVQERFWLQPMLILAVLSGYGFSTITPSIFRGLPGATVVVAYVSRIYVNNWTLMDQSRNVLVEQFATEMLRPLKQNSILLTKGDVLTNSLRYVQVVKKVRTDVVAIDLELLRSAWYVPRLKAHYGDKVTFPGRSYNPGKNGFSAKSFIDSNIKDNKRGLYIAYDFAAGDKKWREHYQLMATGIADQIVPIKANLSHLLKNEKWEGAAPIEATISNITRFEPWDEVVINDYWASLYRRSSHLFEFKKDSVQAAEILEHILSSGSATAKPLIQVVSSRLLVTCFATIITDIQAKGGKSNVGLATRTVGAMNVFLAVAKEYFPDRYEQDIIAMESQRNIMLKEMKLDKESQTEATP